MRTWPSYRTLWVFLLLGWTVSAADRALTGPVVTWMIDNDVARCVATMAVWAYVMAEMEGTLPRGQ